MLALALLAADDGGLRFEGSVAAGGGYDTNLLVAPGEEGLGSAVASLTATGGAAIDLSDCAHSSTWGPPSTAPEFAALSDLDRTAAGASASLLVDLVGPLALVLGSTACLRLVRRPRAERRHARRDAPPCATGRSDG